MALSVARKLSDFYGAEYKNVCTRVFQRIAEVPWQSSKLPECNAFTVTVLLRGIYLVGAISVSDIRDPILAKKKRLPAGFSESRARNSKQCNGKTYGEIARIFAREAPESLAVGRYPPSPVIAYWFVDAIAGLSTRVYGSWWAAMAGWAAKELRRQVSLVAADAHDRMDPVAMAMAACLAQRLRRHSHGKYEEYLPSRTEVRHAIRVLFEKYQLQSGIWNKYFPLFHYPDAGSNYCFAFELIEAILNEFGEDPVIEEELVFAGLENATAWCRDNQITYHDNVEYRGWNSGGDVEALSKGMPEAWATAVVHMYLHKLDHVLTGLIEQRILQRYRRVPTSRTWAEQLDSDVILPGGKKSSVKGLIDEHLSQGLKTYRGASRDRLKYASLPRGQRRSVLLFGPPGTSKTTLVRAFADNVLNWPCIEITPSSFLDKGLPEIYQRANEVFDDLADLSGVVILFDEMDALGRRRDVPPGAGLDITSQFLTTSMLPKLAKLHDDGRVVFFMLTNHRRDFDPAITRPGRFDLLICQGPPEAAKKIEALPRLLKDKDDAAQLEDAKATLTTWMATHEKTVENLDRFTVDEFKALLEGIKQDHGKPLGESLVLMGPAEFATHVTEWTKSAIVLHDDSPLLQEWQKEDVNHTRTQ
jgi:ATPase family associated with various cellular activities (AAA)